MPKVCDVTKSVCWEFEWSGIKPVRCVPFVVGFLPLRLRSGPSANHPNLRHYRVAMSDVGAGAAATKA